MKTKLRYAALALVLGVAFLVGYGTVGKAWPGVPDRSPWYGYFTNTLDTSGDSVLAGGYPASVDSANELISYTIDKLRNGSAQDRTGAAFIIQIMRGDQAGGWSRNRPPTDFEIADWEAGVRYAESQGWIAWNSNFTYSGNSYWQGCCGGGGNPVDDAFYYENGTRLSIIIRNASGGVASVIKRDCANPLTNGYMPGLDRPWTSNGRSTVSTALAVPGQQVTFSHYVRNNGPGTAQMWWATYDSPSGTNLAAAGPNVYGPGQELNVNNENFTVPANAAANMRYCRFVSWDPTNSSGGRYGSGVPACVTVFIPAKIKAVMAVNPANIIAGETATFTPSITVLSSGNPVVVNCTITRVLTPPSGAPQNLGNQPCVDNAGNPNITVSGGGTTLRANAYAAPDNVPVGARVCDNMTITNPVLDAYYQSPTDRTATACVTVAKTPYVHFNGNDVFAGGNFTAVNPACNTGANITTVGRTLSDGSGAGSVGEYGVFAIGTTGTNTGRITGFGSSSKVLTGSGALGAAGRVLTFANSEADPALLGYYGKPQHCINDYVSQFGSSTAIGGGTFDIGTRGSGQWRVTGNATLTGTMPAPPASGAGHQQVYYVQGNVTISGTGVRYPATYASPSAIPSLIIIATGHIYVSPTVSQMDGIFIARGNGSTSGIFYTCWPKNEPASISNPCNTTQLIVNGAVSAARLDLFRSFGGTGASAAQRKDPGERFNFNPEIYIRNVINSSGQTTIQTTNVLELPPRF